MIDSEKVKRLGNDLHDLLTEKGASVRESVSATHGLLLSLLMEMYEHDRKKVAMYFMGFGTEWMNDD